jgi:hypothetical protein
MIKVYFSQIDSDSSKKDKCPLICAFKSYNWLMELEKEILDHKSMER